MKAEDKAKELVNNFYQPLGFLKCQVSSNEMWEYAKQCAIICVDEMIEFCYDNFCVAHRISELKLLKEKINQL